MPDPLDPVEPLDNDQVRSSHEGLEGDARARARRVRRGDGRPVSAEGHPSEGRDGPGGHELERRRDELEEQRGEGVEGQVQEPLIPLHDVPHQGRTHVSQFYQGPLPQPEDLARYGEIREDLVDRIVSMAERDLGARADAIEVTSKAEAFAVRVGATSALAVPVLFVALAIVLAALGASFVIAGVVGAIGPILFGVARVVSAARGRRVDGGMEDDDQEAEN